MSPAFSRSRTATGTWSTPARSAGRRCEEAEIPATMSVSARTGRKRATWPILAAWTKTSHQLRWIHDRSHRHPSAADAAAERLRARRSHRIQGRRQPVRQGPRRLGARRPEDHEKDMKEEVAVSGAPAETARKRGERNPLVDLGRQAESRNVAHRHVVTGGTQPRPREVQDLREVEGVGVARRQTRK